MTGRRRKAAGHGLMSQTPLRLVKGPTVQKRRCAMQRVLTAVLLLRSRFTYTRPSPVAPRSAYVR